MGKVKIKIISHWNVPPEEGYNIGDEYTAILRPCLRQQRPDECYAVLDNGYTIPHGNFEIISGSQMPTKSFEKEFSRGYACALCSIISSHGIDTSIEEAWRANFGSAQTVKSLKQLGIDDYDIAIIKPHLKEINRKKS